MKSKEAKRVRESKTTGGGPRPIDLTDSEKAVRYTLLYQGHKKNVKIIIVTSLILTNNSNYHKRSYWKCHCIIMSDSKQDTRQIIVI